uniref:PAT1 homolog 2 n=1 Tax=Pelusios castaneus TaxID=367368 RepID=A0A8C8VK31_9SAUR
MWHQLPPTASVRGQRERGSTSGPMVSPSSTLIHPGPSKDLLVKEDRTWSQKPNLSFLFQSSGYMSPIPFRPVSRNISAPTQPLGMHFGPMSPSLEPPLFFSPSASCQLKFSHMTQLHPQHQRLLNQRQHISPQKPWSPKVDPYAGLMTRKEKDWVIKVQMMQLQSENPHLDDYYYQTYYHRLERKQAEEELLGGRNKQEPRKLVTPYIQKVESYNSVVRIAGSLGQVAVSTCYSPRRAIDAVHHALLEQVCPGQLHSPEPVLAHHASALLAWSKATWAVGPAGSGSSGLSCREAEDEFLQVLCVRKGKKLTARLLPHLEREQAEEILITITRHLPFLMRKDVLDESLPVLYSPLSQMVGRMTFSELIEVLQELTKPVAGSTELPLTMTFKNQVRLAGRLLREPGTQWWVCLPRTDTVFLVARELSQVPKTTLVEPLFLPSNLLSLFCRYLDKQTIHRLEAKME